MTEFHPAFSNTTGSSSLRWFIAILLNTEIGVKGETVVFERAPDLSRMQTRSHEAKISARTKVCRARSDWVGMPRGRFSVVDPRLGIEMRRSAEAVHRVASRWRAAIVEVA